MTAKRINGFLEIKSDEISYYKKAGLVWMFYHPDCGLGSLEDHNVTEHEDGTITVIPSILITTKHKGKKVTVHGYLTKGVWKPC